MGLGLVSGMNLYATVLTVGLGIRLGLIHLRPELHQLDILANPYILVVAALIFLVEFLADKVKWIDSIWDAVHTLIRPVGAALIGASAVGEVSPKSVIIALMCCGVALSGHSTKAGIRLLANHSPEPFSNVALSLIEDGLVIWGSWFSLQYPNFMLAVVIVFMGIFLWFGPKALRLVRVETTAILAVFKKLFITVKNYVFFRRRRVATADSRLTFDVAPGLIDGMNPTELGRIFDDEMPVTYLYYLKDKLGVDGRQPRIKCVAGKGVRGLRHSIGYLTFTADQVIFVSRRLFRFRNHKIRTSSVIHVHFKKHLLLDQLNLRIEKKSHTFYFFKDVRNRAEMISKTLHDRTSLARTGMMVTNRTR
jgi:hypothetical protein